MPTCTIYLVKKKKNRIYKTDDLLPRILENEGICGFTVTHSPSGAPILVPGNAANSPILVPGNAANSPILVPGNAANLPMQIPNITSSSPTDIQGLAHAPAPAQQAADPLHIPQVSVSDTKGFWACALSDDGDVGLDIEESTRVVKDSVVKKLHTLEQQYLSGLETGSTEWTSEFLNIWTRKEAYSKFCAAGLAIGFKKFSVVDRVLEYCNTVSCQGRPDAFVTQLNLPYGLTGALCAASASTACTNSTAPTATAGINCTASTTETASPNIRIEIFHDDGQPPIPALTAGANLLAMKSSGTAELSAKLQKKGYTKEESDAAAAELASRGYIDDGAYASRQAVLAARSGKSQNLIKRELAGKGLASADIDQAIENLAEETEETEYDRALAQALHILPLPDEDTPKPDDKQFAKVARRLSSLGYGPGIIYSILDKYR